MTGKNKAGWQNAKKCLVTMSVKFLFLNARDLFLDLINQMVATVLFNTLSFSIVRTNFGSVQRENMGE